MNSKKLECPICESVYDFEDKQPILLECKHNVCQGCLDYSYASEYGCPECRLAITSRNNLEIDRQYLNILR